MPTIWSDLLHLFFPKLCITCKCPLIHEEEHICLTCLCDLPQTNFWEENDNPVAQLFTGKVDVVNASAVYFYEKGSKVQQIVHLFKYHDNKKLAYIFGRHMALAVQSCTAYQSVEILIPVPLHAKKERKRGYNQSEWLCRGIASVWERRPVITNALTRISASKTQTNKSIYDRWLNVHEIFTLQNKQVLEGKHILLVDDVITSGSTLLACAEILITVPDVRISVLTLAAS